MRAEDQGHWLDASEYDEPEQNGGKQDWTLKFFQLFLEEHDLHANPEEHEGEHTDCYLQEASATSDMVHVVILQNLVEVECCLQVMRFVKWDVR